MGRGDSFGQKKGENREFRYTPPRPYKRWEGTTPIYSTYQSKRYKSLWNRYTAGEELSRRESDQIKDNAGNTTAYRFYSDRSNVGYWEVTRQNQTLQGSKFKVVCNYTSYTTGSNPNPTRVMLTSEWIVEFFDSTYNPVNTTFSFGQDYSSPTAFINGSYRAQDYALRFIDFGVAAYARIDNTDPLLATDPASHRNVYPGDIPAFRSYSYYDSTLVARNRKTTLQFYTGVTCADVVGANCNPEYTFSAEMSYTVTPLSGGSTQQGDWACNCPDYTKEERPFVEGLWPSLQEHRVWTDSQAGSPGDCKHIIAAKFLAGEPPDPPSYDTIAPDETDTSILKPWNPKRRSGDDFSADLTW